MGNIMFNQYKIQDENTLPVSLEKSKTLYFLQQGVYSNKENMESNLSSFNYYIYNEKDNLYYAYVAITGDKDNLEKIEGYFKNLGYDLYVKEFTVENTNFIEVLNQYEELLKQTNDEKTIASICGQILSKYEELVLNAQNEGTTSKW